MACVSASTAERWLDERFPIFCRRIGSVKLRWAFSSTTGVESSVDQMIIMIIRLFLCFSFQSLFCFTNLGKTLLTYGEFFG